MPAAGRALSAAILVAQAALACSGDPTATDTSARRPAPAVSSQASLPMPSAATLPPLAYLLKQIGGDRVEVVSVVPSAAVAESYHPTIQQVEQLSRVRLVLRVGDPSDRNRPPVEVRLDPVWERLDDLATVTMPVARDAIEPHPWLSPASMLDTAQRLAAVLERLDDSGGPEYRRALAKFTQRVADLDREMRGLLVGPLPVTVVVVHPAWSALAADYGLRQIALEVEGKEPSARRLVELIDLAREAGVSTIFVQRGYPTAAAHAIARELGAEIVEVDPLAFDWPDNLLATARLFAQAGTRTGTGSGPKTSSP